MFRAVLLATLLVLAGCQAPGFSSSDTPVESTATAESNATATAESTATTTPESNATPASSATATPDKAASAVPDPESDRLGWENGIWYNETLSIDNSDGLNASEREQLVARSMARVERVRGLEFDETVPVSVINRSEYRHQSSSNESVALRRFDNAKFEALFLIGEQRDSIAEQEATFGQSVLGYYSPREDEIVIVSDSETPQLDGEATLAHELVHAIQDQQFGLTNRSARTRDAVQGRNGIVEGDAAYVEQRYMANCGEAWSCLARSGGSGGGGGDTHFGLNFLFYFPYSDGPGLVDDRYQAGGWDAVDAVFADPPDGSTEVIYPDRYPEWEPENVSLPDRSSADWERVRPPDRPDYAVVGQSAIAASLAYAVSDDYNSAYVVSPRDVYNIQPNDQINQSDPYNYDTAATRGWTGGRMHVYENGEELGYVWRTAWENESEAAEFARTWELVVEHWGGEPTGENTWVVESESPFADAIRIEQSGNTVTVVNAPETSELDAIHDA